MLNIASENLVNRYAQAFLRAFCEQISPDIIEELQQAHEFLCKRKEAIAMVAVLSSCSVDQEAFSGLFLKYLPLKKQMDRLLRLLFTNKAVIFLPDILNKIIILSKKWHSIVSVTVESSHKLLPAQMEQVKKSLSRQIGSNIDPIFCANKKLIVGICIKTDQYLWEYSAAKRVSDLEQSYNFFLKLR